MGLGEFLDEWGPEKIVFVNDAKTGLRGVVVIDNTALGPGKGGVRFVPDVTAEEVFRLARAMTWKNALAGIPFGGAKAGVLASAGLNKELVFRAFARAIKPLVPDYYIPGPDMNTTEKEMGIIAEELKTKKAATGKPLSMGGLPHELGSTGFGVAESAEVAAKHLGISLKGATVAIEGFGNVGTFAAKFLSEKDAKIVAVSDSKGTIYNEDGLDVEMLIKVKNETGAVKNYSGVKVLDAEDLFSLPIDILIPGARPDVINEKNVNKVKAKIIIEAANIPMRPEFEKKLESRGVIVVPDFVANAGGVISSYVEFTEGTEEEMFKTIKEKIIRNTKLVLEKAKKEDKGTRDVALQIAQERVSKVMKCKSK